MPTTDMPNDRPDPWADPRTRDFGFVGLVALVVVFVGMALRGGPATALLAPVAAGLGLALRWPSAGGLTLFVLTYLLVFPFGVPTLGVGDQLPGGPHFRIVDLVLVAAVAVYFGCYHRALGLTARAVPEDPAAAPTLPRLPPELAAADGGMRRVLATAAAATFAGQVLWYALAHLTIDFDRVPPIVPLTAAPGRSPRPAPTAVRLALFGGLLAVVSGVGWFVLWYRRLVWLTPAEARMALLDTGWRETRRELNRLEKWRARGRPGGRFDPPDTPDRRAERARRRRWLIAAGVALVAAAWLALRAFTAVVLGEEF